MPARWHASAVVRRGVCRERDTGTGASPRRRSRSRMRRVASRPSTTGIWQSISTRSMSRSTAEPSLTASSPLSTLRHVAADALQHRLDHQRVDLVVLGQQHAARARCATSPSSQALSRGGGVSRCGSTGASGRSSTNSEPRPEFALAARWSRPWRGHLARDAQAEAGAAGAAAPGARLVEGLEHAGQVAGAMPWPVSRTQNSTTSLPGSRSTCSATSPASVNFSALPSRLCSTCRNRVGSPLHPALGAELDVRRKAELAFSSQRTK